MSGPNLIIGGFRLPLSAYWEDFRQTYDDEAGIGEIRLADGSLVIQRAWPATGVKLLTTLAARGRMPPLLAGLDRGVAHEIACIEPIHLPSLNTAITLPAGRRADTGYTPRGYAMVDGELVSTPVLSVVAHVATLQAVAGASHYEARYWPKFSGRITYRQDGTPLRGGRGWTLTIKET